VRLHGRVRIAATGAYPKDSIVVICLARSEKVPFGNRLVMCGSFKARFEFWLPPGNYEIEAAGNDESGRRCTQDPFPRITLRPGQQDLDFGVLDLTRSATRGDRIHEAQAKGTWAGVEYTKRYGQPAPKWHAVDVRGISKETQLSDLKGKWVLVYFWSTHCEGCLARVLPGLTAFYEAHRADRDRFEIVGVCNEEPEIGTMADLDRELQPVIKTVWHGKPLPFPVVLDNTLKTAENFGVDFGIKLLFDPDGRLVPGDEHTLAEKLAAAPRKRSHP
jgi:thiol-disulfide isomerase/thioredoxin